MKRLLLVVVLVLPAAAQEPDRDIHDALRQLKATMTRALNERDLDTIVANVDPDVVFTTMNNDVRRGPAQIRAYFHEMLTAPGHVVKDVKVSFEADALTALYGGDAGVAYGSSNDHAVFQSPLPACGERVGVRGHGSPEEPPLTPDPLPTCAGRGDCRRTETPRARALRSSR